MKTILTISLLFLIASCKTWDWGETFIYTIPKGEHSDIKFPKQIPGTEVWGGMIKVEYDVQEMEAAYLSGEDFSHWNKFGGVMPDLTSNVITGQHQSARLAWRIDPPEMDYVYLGYIVYVWGQNEPSRGYLFTPDGEKVKVRVGQEFFGTVVQHKEWWGVYYEGETAYKKIEDDRLKEEEFMVVMDPYYGGKPTAPTEITITLTIKDTTVWY